jgi:adenosylhomocysteine nucleosidase
VIVFVAAESREFGGFLRHLRNRRRLPWPVQYAISAELNGREVVLIADGPGPDLAGHAAEVVGQQAPVEALVSTGFCGALRPGLEPGTIIVASAIVDEGGKVIGETAVPVVRLRAVKERLLSLNRVLVTALEKRDAGALGAAVEMEAAGVLEYAHKWEIPFYGIRVVTDTVNEGFSIDFNRMRDSDGRFSRSRIIKEACRNPFKLFPELLQFDRRCRRAATLLGDFIADCQF